MMRGRLFHVSLCHPLGLTQMGSGSFPPTSRAQQRLIIPVMAAAATATSPLWKPLQPPPRPEPPLGRRLRLELGRSRPRLSTPGRRKSTLPPARFSLLSDTLLLLDASTAGSVAEVGGAAEAAAGGTGYSLASYYTSLGLFVISVPGLWSLIKRSVKSKIVQKTFVRDGGPEAAPPSRVAGEILSFFTRNNFDITDRGETITFEGMMTPSRGQAALLTFCTCISLGSVGLVLSITVPEGGNNWFWLTVLSPLAGLYYWKRASRKEEIKVKMIVGEDGTLSEIIVRGDDQQVEQMRKELQLSEKGMIYVKGIFET